MHTVEFPRALRWGCLLALMPLGCSFPGQVHIPRGAVEQSLDERAEQAAGADPEPGREVWSRRDLIREVLRRHPELRAKIQRARGKIAGVSAAEGLPPPMAMTQVWQAPLRPPFLYGQGTMFMLGIQQSFPPGKARSAEAQSMLEEAHAMSAEVAVRERELIAQVGFLVVELEEARAQVKLHESHRKLLNEMGATARARQTTSAGALLELSRIERELAAQIAEEDMARGEEQRARASLNLLLGRPPEGPLDVQPEPNPGPPTTSLSELLDHARNQNPEILAASILARREVARAEAAEQMSNTPMYTVGVNYGWMGPHDPNNHTWGATFSMTLPWLSKSLSAQRQAGIYEREASRSDLAATQLRVEQAVATAHAQALALDRRLDTLQKRLLPASRRAAEAARTGYITGGSEAAQWIESAHDLREVELMLVSARAALDRALLTLELATGTSLTFPERPAPQEAP